VSLKKALNSCEFQESQRYFFSIFYFTRLHYQELRFFTFFYEEDQKSKRPEEIDTVKHCCVVYSIA